MGLLLVRSAPQDHLSLANTKGASLEGKEKTWGPLAKNEHHEILILEHSFEKLTPITPASVSPPTQLAAFATFHSSAWYNLPRPRERKSFIQHC